MNISLAIKLANIRNENHCDFRKSVLIACNLGIIDALEINKVLKNEEIKAEFMKLTENQMTEEFIRSLGSFLVTRPRLSKIEEPRNW